MNSPVQLTLNHWGNKQYVATSGLIVADKFRNRGLAKRIKKSFLYTRKATMAESEVVSASHG
jgi:hypothetical protein